MSSFSLLFFHHTETCMYSFLMPFRSTFPGEILEYITIGQVLLSCGMICGYILFPTSHDNVELSLNLLYTNSFTLIIGALLSNKIYFQCLYNPLIACLNTFAKCFKARSLLSMIPCLKKDLGAMRGVPNSKYFQYSASPCLVPMTNSNLEFCWCQMDLLRSPVTLLDGSFGGLAGSLGVIFKISSSSTITVSTKAISIAFSSIA